MESTKKPKGGHRKIFEFFALRALLSGRVTYLSFIPRTRTAVPLAPKARNFVLSFPYFPLAREYYAKCQLKGEMLMSAYPMNHAHLDSFPIRVLSSQAVGF